MRIPLPAKLHTARRSVWAGLGICVLLVIFGVIAVSKHSHGDANAKPAPTELDFVASDLTQLTPRPLAVTLPVNGNLEARSEAVVRAKASLDVKQIAVREGDPVHAGQLLAQLDTAALRAELAEKISTRDSAKAQFGTADKNRTTNQQLLEKKFISQNAFDAFDGTYHADRASLDAANANVDVARIAVEQATVTAPISGIVAKRSIKVGEKTSVDGELFTIVDLDSLELQALVPAGEVGRLQRGMRAQIKVDGIDDETFTGILDRISPATEEGTRSIMTFFTVSNTRHRLRSGMYATGSVALNASAPVPSLPVTAVRNEAGQPVVWTVEHGVLTRHPVVIGLRDDEHGFVEIKQGLPADVPVIATKLDDLKEGAPAKAVLTHSALPAASSAHA